ncbi:hypothetical protein [Ferrovibrio xuzhouensis]|uniref:Lipoprotein n=1 Tax=Ferrovibrio xuzhouensis TaxID=1576914 RepID=A0ABV7VIL5_9PROT
MRAVLIVALFTLAACTYTPSEIRDFPSKLTGHTALAPQQAANCTASQIADKSSSFFATPRPSVLQGKAPGAVAVILYSGNFLTGVIDFVPAGGGSDLEIKLAPGNMSPLQRWAAEAVQSCDPAVVLVNPYPAT